MTPTPIEHLDELLGALLLGPETLDSRTRCWIVSGLIHSLRTGERLEICLGLAGRGVRTLKTQVVQLERDIHLLEALRCMFPVTQVLEWRHCVQMAQEVARFMRTAWPQTRLLNSPASRFNGYQRCIWQAARLGQPVPENARHYYNLLQANEVFSFQERRPKMLSRFLIPPGAPCNGLPSLELSMKTPSPSLNNS